MRNGSRPRMASRAVTVSAGRNGRRPRRGRTRCRLRRASACRCSVHTAARIDGHAAEAEGLRRAPEPQQQQDAAEGGDRADDVGQVGAEPLRGGVLAENVRQRTDHGQRPRAAQPAPPRDQVDQDPRRQQRQDRHDPADRRRELEDRHLRHGGQGDDRARRARRTTPARCWRSRRPGWRRVPRRRGRPGSVRSPPTGNRTPPGPRAARRAPRPSRIACTRMSAVAWATIQRRKSPNAPVFTSVL